MKRLLSYINKPKLTAGFTLVELLVTITIFVILTGVVLFNQSQFNSTILLTNLAYDTALTIRQAQTYGINIKGFNGGNQFVPYGAHFETGTNNKSFILFADLQYLTDPRAHVYGSTILSTCDTGSGCVSRYNIQRGNYISKLEVLNNSGVTSTVNKLDLLFQRPNPDALIYGNGSIGTSYAKATIYLTSSDGSSSRRIEVQSNGLIQIDNK